MAGTRSRVSRTAVALALFGGLVTTQTTGAAATDFRCGDVDIHLDGIRLLNDGISETAGPFAIILPAGRYDITVSSFDDHAAHPNQDQPNEQWYFTLDSGYQSPVTSDIPDESNMTTDSWADQTIGATTSVTLWHLGVGNVNSVEPICIGFTAVPGSAADDDPMPESTVVDDPAMVEEPAADASGDRLRDRPSSTTTPPDVEVLSEVEERTRETTSSTSQSQPNELPAVLALTGGELMSPLVGLGIGLLALGSIAQLGARSPSDNRRRSRGAATRGGEARDT